MDDAEEQSQEWVERPRLTIDLPLDMPDEVALHIAQFLEDFYDRFQEHYHKQLVRAYRARDRQYKELRRKNDWVGVQLGVPFNDDEKPF